MGAQSWNTIFYVSLNEPRKEAWQMIGGGLFVKFFPPDSFLL